MQIVTEEGGRLLSISTKELEHGKMKAIKSSLAASIMRELAKSPKYPLEIAKSIGMHEQKVYYHIRNLEKAGFVKKARQDIRQGVVLHYYAPAGDSFFVKFGNFTEVAKLRENSDGCGFLSPFIENGKLNSLIVLGSPESHGPEKAKGRDALYAMDFTLFLGTFLHRFPSSAVKLDTEMTKEDLKQNLIVIGGPVVNKVTRALNPVLPVYFDEASKWAIKSRISKCHYNEDECGLIVKAGNPFAEGSKVLLIGGKRQAGTKAAISAMIKNIERLSAGNAYNRKHYAYVVEGIDADSDGIIDSAEFRE